MSGAKLTDYLPSLDLSEDVFKRMETVAFKVGGTLGLTPDGRIVITGENLTYKAVAIAALITDADFPYGFVVPATDSILTFEF